MTLKHSARVAAARKVLAERPVEITREQMAEKIAHFLEAFYIADGASEAASVADDLIDVVWPVIESKDVAIAKRDAALEAVLTYNDELLAIVNEVAGKEIGSSSPSSGGGSS